MTTNRNNIKTIEMVFDEKMQVWNVNANGETMMECISTSDLAMTIPYILMSPDIKEYLEDA